MTDAARELMHSRGFEAVGVDEICQQAGVRKGSFYHFFTSKQRLGLAAIDDYWNHAVEDWAGLNKKGTALERLTTWLSGFRAAQEADRKACGSMRGCLLGNIAAERAAQDEAIRARLVEVFDAQCKLIADLLRELQNDGLLPADHDTDRAARTLLAHVQGMVMIAKVNDDPSILDDLPGNALSLLGVTTA